MKSFEFIHRKKIVSVGCDYYYCLEWCKVGDDLWRIYVHWPDGGVTQWRADVCGNDLWDGLVWVGYVVWNTGCDQSNFEERLAIYSKG